MTTDLSLSFYIYSNLQPLDNRSGMDKTINLEKCKRSDCQENAYGYCLTCQISSPTVFDHEKYAKEFETFPRCQNCIADFHKGCEVMPCSVVSFNKFHAW